jgi:hypothetical protein
MAAVSFYGSVQRRRKKYSEQPDPQGHAKKIYEILTTVSICGANFLIVVSTPALSVMWFTLHEIQAPSRRTVTCLSSSIETSLISPPSELRNGRIS